MAHCIIIGAGPGLGQAIARRFGAEGHRIGLVARDPASLQSMAEGLSERGMTTASEAADAGNPDALTRAIDALEQRQGPCTTLVYNAAVLKAADPLTLSVARLRAEFDVNLVGGLVAAQAVAPAMMARGSGAILFTGGGLALEPYPEWSSLALGKAALRNLAFSLNKTLAPKGVQVAVIAICGIVAEGTPFDPNVIADEYWRLAQAPPGAHDRELIFQPEGTDPFYNDPQRAHRATTVTPAHVNTGDDGA